MPIYMDRHDVSESVTAEIIAELHQQDLKVQDRFGCRGLTYWFDARRKTAFCLIEAPTKEAIHDMHDFAHGKVPHQVIEVDPSIVESFLGRIEDPVKEQDTELNIISDPAFRAIMVINIKLLALTKINLDRWQLGAQRLGRVVPDILREFGGNLVKQSRDQFLLSFRSVSKAVNAALRFREAVTEVRNGIPGDKFCLKVGLSTGEPVTAKNLIFQDAIRLAERMTMMGKDEIVVSAEVRDLYDGENAVGLTARKGVCCLSQEDEQFITRLMDHAEKNWCDTELKVEDLNKEVGYSKPQLYRKMILLTGKSPVTFIKDYRLDSALGKLNKEAGNVSQIAYETGFSSPSYFTKCFQKRYGQSPTDYLAARRPAGMEPVPE